MHNIPSMPTNEVGDIYTYFSNVSYNGDFRVEDSK